MVTIQNRDLQQELNTNKFGSIFKLNMLLAILDGSRYHGCKYYTVKHRDLPQKPNTWVNLQLEHVASCRE